MQIALIQRFKSEIFICLFLIYNLFQIPIKVEKQVPRTKCKKVPEKKCQDFPIFIPRKACKDFPKTVCVKDPMNVPRKIPKKVCASIPKEVCNKIPVQIIKHVPKTVTKKVCTSTKPSGYTPYSDEASYYPPPSYSEGGGYHTRWLIIKCSFFNFFGSSILVGTKLIWLCNLSLLPKSGGDRYPRPYTFRHPFGITYRQFSVDFLSNIIIWLLCTILTCISTRILKDFWIFFIKMLMEILGEFRCNFFKTGRFVLVINSDFWNFIEIADIDINFLKKVHLMINQTTVVLNKVVQTAIQTSEL